MSSSEINLKQSLRKTEFPLCSKEALSKIGDLICGRNVSIKNMDLALDLMSEFVFCEIDRRGNKRTSQITALSELHLLEILFDFFVKQKNEVVKNTVFLSLFSGTTVVMRFAVLSKLVSLAVGVPSASILTSASTWMQQLGNTSNNSVKLAEAIVKDYFYLVPNPVERLKVLPQICPQFTANFLTAIAENYFIDNKKDQIFPPDSLLETITLWIMENSSLCIAAQQRQSVLPVGAIAMECTTPIAGLLRWCVVAPLYNQNSKLYSQLHLALLQSILEIPSSASPKAIWSQHLSVPVRLILILGKQRDENMCANLQLAVDRYAQAVQVALYVNCVYGKVEDLLIQLQKLPHNKLLSIIIDTHKK